jgi:hypothetical protein
LLKKIQHFALASRPTFLRSHKLAISQCSTLCAAEMRAASLAPVSKSSPIISPPS